MKFSKNDNFNKLENRMYISTIPAKKCKKNYIGLEIEILTKVPKEIITWELAKLGVTADVGGDGSIKRSKDNPFTAEVRLLIEQTEVSKTVPLVISTLKDMGSEVNKSCGLHVHIDMRNRKVADCYKKLVEKQSVLRKMVAKNRLRNRYCKMNKAIDFKEAISGKTIYRQDSTGQTFADHTRPEGHYSSINPQAYRDYKTLEVRLHEGTLDSDKIVKWVNTLVETIDGKAA